MDQIIIFFVITTSCSSCMAIFFKHLFMMVPIPKREELFQREHVYTTYLQINLNNILQKPLNLILSLPGCRELWVFLVFFCWFFFWKHKLLVLGKMYLWNIFLPLRRQIAVCFSKVMSLLPDSGQPKHYVTVLIAFQKMHN